MSQWREDGPKEGDHSFSRRELHRHLQPSLSGTSTTSSARRSTQVGKKDIIELRSGFWKGLSIRFGKDLDFVDGFTLKSYGSRLQFLGCVFPDRLGLEHSVTFSLNSENDRLEVKEKLLIPREAEIPPTMVISRSVWVHSNDFIVLRANSNDAEKISDGFTIRIMLKPSTRFKTAIVRIERTAVQQADAMILKALEDKIIHMRYLEVLVPEFQSKDADYKSSLLAKVEVWKALRARRIRLANLGQSGFGHGNPQVRQIRQQSIRVSFPSHSSSQSTDDNVTAAPEAAISTCATHCRTDSASTKVVDLISDYKSPPLTILKDIARCPAGANLGAGFELLSVDDKLKLLDKKIQDMAIKDRLENALIWIEGYERAIELDESDTSIGKGYVGEQTYTLGQVGCPYPVVDLLYVMAKCRLQKRREAEAAHFWNVPST